MMLNELFDMELFNLTMEDMMTDIDEIITDEVK